MADTVRLRQHQHSTGESAARSVLQLTSLVVAGVAVGFLLWWLNGLPQVPRSLPDWGRIGNVLSGSYLPYEDVIDDAAGVGWLALGYLTLTVTLRLSAQSLTRLTDGATWTRAALSLSDVVTLPAVRRIVDGAIAGSLFVSVWLRPSATLAADTSPQMTVAAVVSSAQAVPVSGMTRVPIPPIKDAVEEPESPDHVVSYTIVAGDSLWDISRRFYGDGTLYTLIFETNQGRVTTTGERFTDPRLIRPGWVLDVPLPAHNVQVADLHLTYRVQSGDSLWRIAENFLGDGFRWTGIWELNQGRDMGGGRRLTDPDLILPGWLLELPIEATSTPPTSAPSQEPTATTLAPVPSPTAVPSVTPETASAPVSRPKAEPVQPSSGNDGSGLRWPDSSLFLAVTAGLAAVGVTGLVVRRLRRNGAAPLRVDTQVGLGKRPAGDVGKVVVATRALLRGLAELGFEDVRVVLVREAERFLDFTLDCAPGDAEALVRARYDLGRRLACAVDGEVVGPARVRLKLSRFQRLAGLLLSDGALREPLLLVPVGAADNGVHYLNLATAGTTLVVGSQHESRQILSAWLATMAAICGPDELAFLPAGTVAAHLGELTRLPHFAVDGDSREQSVEELASELEEMIVARDASVRADRRVALVALVGLSGDCKGDADRLETILRRGPEREIYVAAVAEGAPDPESVRAFGARVVFGGSDDGSESAQQDGLGVKPGEVALFLGREPSMVLQPVEVRTEVLRPLTRREGGLDCEEPSPSGHGQAAAIEDQSEVPAPEPCESPPEAVEESVEADGAISPGRVEEGSPVGDPADDADPAAPDHRAARQPALLLEEEEDAEGEGAGASAPIFTVRCFGSFQVETATGEVTGWTIQKARELLAYLIARGGTPVLREEVAEALWPDTDRAQVEHLLSNAAYYLRRTLKSAMAGTDLHAFVTSSQRYHLRSGAFRVEADSFDAHLRRAERLDGVEALVEYDRALSIYRGDFLGNEPYEWAEPYRREYERRFIEAAHRVAKLAVDCRDVSKAMEFYSAILARDPIDEEAARGLMRCYSKLADVNGVRKVYKVLTESLRRELEDEKAEPLPETTTLMRDLRAAP